MQLDGSPRAAPPTLSSTGGRRGSSIRDHLFAPMVLLTVLLVAGQAHAQFVKTNVASFGTSSTTFTPVTGGSLTFTPATNSEIWIILVSARLMSTQTASFTLSAEARYRVNGTEHGIGGILNSAANKGASWQHFYRVTGTTAAQTVQVDLRDDSGATATIADLQIIAFLLPSGADFRYTENEAIRAIPSPWTTYETLGFTPSSPGTYLVMALANGTEDPGTGGIGIRLEHPAATYWPDMSGGNRLQYMSNTRIPWQSFFLARAVSLTATPQTFNLQATGDLAPGSQIAYTRIMAFRTDAFDRFESQEDTGIASTTSTTPVVRSTLTTAAPPTARDYVVIQSQVISGTAAVDENRAGFEADDVVQMSYDHVFNGSFHYGSFGFFDVVTTSASVKYENTWSTSNAASAVEIKESVIHVLRLPLGVHSRSIGINPGNLHAAGTAAVAQGSRTVTFSSALPDPGAVGAVGPGDELTIEGETLFISSRSSAFQVTVETAATVDHSTPTAVFTITRAYNTVSAWEADISVGGRGGDLVGESRREIGFAYKDGVFTNGFSISGSTTDSSRYMHLTVPPGQRHTGIAGTGVVLDGGGTMTETAALLDDYTRFEWFEVRFYRGADGNLVDIRAQNVLVSHLIVHDFDDPVNTNIDGISIRSTVGTWSVTVRNCIVYDGGDSCIQGDTADDTITVENSTLYGCRRGVHEDTGSTMNVRNTIAMGNSTADFNVTAGVHSNNLSQDGSPAGAPPLTGLPANQFVSIVAGSEDFHLKSGADAIDAGVSLSASFIKDIDDELRPKGVQWDIGADERPPDVTCPTEVRHWYDVDWGFRKAIVVHSSKVTAVQPDFPVLINLATDGDLAANAQADGDDIVFTAADGVTTLSHEIEKFCGAVVPGCAVANGELVAWVKVPYLSSGVDTTIWMYYGNGTVSSQEDRLNVWDANHVGVWHLKEQPTGLPGDMQDSTSKLNHGSSQNMEGSDQMAGRIDGSVGLDGSAEYIPVGNNAVSFAGQQSYSLSAWIYFNPGQLTKAEFILEKPGNYWLWWNGDNTFGLGDDTLVFGHENGAGQDQIAWPWSPLADTWYHLVGVHDAAADTNTLYVNAGLLGSAAAASNVADMSGTSPEIGRRVSSADRHFDGQLDEIRISDVARTADWIQTEFNNQSDPGTFCTVCNATTEVELLSFTARGADGAVELGWETASELDNLGFHVYRATSEGGSYQRITAVLIPGLGSSPVGARYSYRDTGLTNGVTYFYELEDVETTGRTERHGPVSATPQETAAEEPDPETSDDPPAGPSGDPPAPEAEPSSPVRIAYGDPASSALQVIRRGRRHVDLELVTGGFYALPQSDGSVRLEVPGLDLLSEAGSPELPVKRTWLEAVAGRKVKLGRVRARGIEGFSGLRPVNAAAAELVSLGDGTIRVARRRARRAYRTSGALYPADAARVLEVGFQGEVKKALLELRPLRWDESSGQLLLARRLRVRVSFKDREPGELSLGGSRGRRRRAKTSGEPATVARLAVREAGLYGVSFEDLFPAQRRGVRLSELRLSRQGEAVPYNVEPSRRRIGPGSVLYFWSAGAALNSWGQEAVYELERSGEGGPRMEVVTASPSGVSRAHGWRLLDLEVNRHYMSGLLEAPDLWLWELVLSGARKSVPFDLEGLVPSGEPGRLEVWLQGVSDFEADPDHHVRVLLNGVVVGEHSWDGKRGVKVEGDLWPGALLEAGNVLELENVGDTDAAYSYVALDRFTVEYPGALASTGGEYAARFRHGGVAEVSGLGAGAKLLDLTGDHTQWLSGAEPTASGLSFRVESGHRYLAVSPESVRVPEVRPASTSGLRSTSNQADYVLLAPHAYLEPAQPLLEQRRGQGLRAVGVALEEVADEFGHGEPTPEAIREFLSYAYHEWQPPSLRYVLLLGDATFDPKDYLGVGTRNDVPALLVKTSHLWTASDPAYGALNGEDLLPDVAVGRLPASSVEEARGLVEKILAWESWGWDLASGPFVLVADNSDRAGDFEGDAERASQTLLQGREVEKIYLSELGSEARTSIYSAFDHGAGLVSYLGHGGTTVWASENVLNFTDVPRLAPQPQQPLLLTMNCLNGYFLSPSLDSLSELLVLAPDKGAIAAFSPSGMSIHSAASRYHEALLRELVSGKHARLGDAVLAAQVSYADTGALPELLALYHLFGDPALTLR